jgi:hypothetical protein
MLTNNTMTDSVRELCGHTVEHIDSPLNSSLLYHSDAPKQDNLHCDMQECLHARGAKSLAMKTIGQQVSDYMKWRGWKSRQMAEHIQKQPGGESVKRQHIENLVKTGVDQPKYLHALAVSMGVTTDDLLQGRYEIPAHKEAGTDQLFELPQEEVRKVDMLQDHTKANGPNLTIRQFDTGGSMGTGVVLQDQPGVIQSMEVSQEWVQKNIRNFSSVSNLAIVTGFGDSMKPLFSGGDPLLVDRAVKKVKYEAIYFFRVGDEGFVKRLQRIPGKGILVISENTAYRDWTITEDMDFEVFARVVKVWCGEDF